MRGEVLVKRSSEKLRKKFAESLFTGGYLNKLIFNAEKSRYPLPYSRLKTHPIFVVFGLPS